MPGAATSISTGAKPMAVSSERQSRPRRRWPIVLAVVCLLVLAGAALVWLTPARELVLAMLPLGRSELPPMPRGAPSPTGAAATETLVQTPTSVVTATPEIRATQPQPSTLTPTATTAPPTLPPTSTPRPTATFPPTATPLLTATAAATPTPVEPSPAPPATLHYHTLSLQGIANANIAEGYVGPPLGNVTLGSVPFNLGQGGSVTTQAEPLPDHPQQVRLPADVPRPHAVYLLVTGGNMYSRFAGRVIGLVRLVFDDGADYDIDLISGQNIREWKHSGEGIVSEASSPDLTEVWRGQNRHDEGTAVIDMLTIWVPEGLRGKRLSSIEINDRSTETVGEMDPALNWIGATVAGAENVQPTPAPPACQFEPEGRFAALWQQHRDLLGCPLNQPTQSGAATERFQHGRMIWGENRDWHYVLYDDGTWESYGNEYEEGMQEPGIYQPPTGLFVPVLGFGIVWHKHLGGADARIGWATEQEYWLPIQVQDFETGLAIEMESVTYLLGDSAARWFTP